MDRHCYACAVRECAARGRCACKAERCTCGDAITKALRGRKRSAGKHRWQSEHYPPLCDEITAAYWLEVKHVEKSRREKQADAKDRELAFEAIDRKIQRTKEEILPLLTCQFAYVQASAYEDRKATREEEEYDEEYAEDDLTTEWYQRQALRHDKVVLQLTLTERGGRVQVKLFIRDEGLERGAFVPRVSLDIAVYFWRSLVTLTMQVTEVRAVTRSTLPTELGKQVVCIMCVDSSGRVRLSLLCEWPPSAYSAE